MRYFILTLLFLTHVHAADWPNWRGPRYDGISTEKLPKADFSKIAWRAKMSWIVAVALMSMVLTMKANAY